MRLSLAFFTVIQLRDSVAEERTTIPDDEIIMISSQNAFFTKYSDLFNEVISYCNKPDGYDTTKYGPIEYWDVSRITEMFYLFDVSNSANKNADCNPDISRWDVSAVTSFNSMFAGSRFTQDISSWDVSSASDFEYMFQSATLFNGDIGGWDVSNGSVFSRMFYAATSFNGNIGTWDVAKGFSFGGMFQSANSFNQDISGWDVSNGFRFDNMLSYNKSFNQDISSWDLSRGYYFNELLKNASAFRQNLDSWLQWINNGSSPSWCDGAVCDLKLCVNLDKKKCEKEKEVCTYGRKKKTWEDCKAKEKKYEHDCAQYTSRRSCVSVNKQLCDWNDGVCSHVCDLMQKRTCRGKKVKMCTTSKIKNPCRGCHPKSKC